jgi:hypothetical protein
VAVTGRTPKLFAEADARLGLDGLGAAGPDFNKRKRGVWASAGGQIGELSLLKNVIWLEIGSRVKIGMRIFINRMEHLLSLVRAGFAGGLTRTRWR